MAEQYIQAIKQIQPAGPYQFVGYSGGGMIAFEMAQRLVAMGDEVSFLGLLDTFTPDLQERKLTLREHIGWIRKDGFSTYMLQRIQNYLERKEETELEFELLAMRVPEDREKVLFGTFVNAVENYCPKPYPGTAVLFRGEEIWQVHDHYPEDYGWKDCIPDLEIAWVEGDHLTMLDEKNVYKLGMELKKRLKK